MSRKNHRAANTVPTARPPRAAMHHRRNRAIRHVRSVMPAATVALTPRSIRSFAPRWKPLLRDAVPYILIILFGVGISMTLFGLAFVPAATFTSPYTPGVHAGQMFLPALILTGVSVSCLNRRRLCGWIARINRHEASLIPLAALVAGVFVLALPVLLAAIEGISGWSHAHFVFSDPLVRIEHLCGLLPACFVGGVVFLELGTLLVGGPWTGSKRGAIICMAVGMFAGVVAAFSLTSKPALLLPAASLPIFFITLIAANFAMPLKPTPRAA